MKKLPLLMVLTLCMALFLACTLPPKEKDTDTFTGKILKKPWTKSTQSYCAQGSDYYVLQIDRKVSADKANAQSGVEYVIHDKSVKRIKDLVGKTITCTGKLITETIEEDDNPQSQHPVSIDGQNFSCTQLKISKVLE